MKNLKDVEKAIIIVPHQDDELSVAGAVIGWLVEKKVDIYVCYATNGDYEFDADIRYKEAVNALNILGVPQDHVIMLGYPDTSNENLYEHIFYYEYNKRLCSQAKHEYTYGTKNFHDFAFLEQGSHHPYNRVFYEKDIKDVVMKLLPDLFVVVDMDHHSDHRMLSITFEKVMGCVLKENKGYHPIVWKAFSYGTSLGAVCDYWEINMNKTLFPPTRLEHNNGRIDNPFYNWNDRVRIPVKREWYDFPIENGKWYKELECHKSQKAVLFAEKMINSDQVAWERRTDNLGLYANIEASSGDVSGLNDFMLYDAAEIHIPERLEMIGFWKPNVEDRKKQIKIQLDSAEKLEKIVIWGIASGLKLELCWNGHSVKYDYKNVFGNAEFYLPEGVMTDCIDMFFEYNELEEFGIGEIEIFRAEDMIPQYLKLLTNDLMVETYYTCLRIPKIEVYEYCVNNLKRQNVEYDIQVNGKKVKNFPKYVKLNYLRNKRICISVGDKKIQNLTAKVEIVFLTPIEWIRRKKQLKRYAKSFEQKKQKVRELVVQ